VDRCPEISEKVTGLQLNKQPYKILRQSVFVREREMLRKEQKRTKREKMKRIDDWNEADKY